jgi:hypothetical protein
MLPNVPGKAAAPAQGSRKANPMGMDNGRVFNAIHGLLSRRHRDGTDHRIERADPWEHRARRAATF